MSAMLREPGLLAELAAVKAMIKELQANHALEIRSYETTILDLQHKLAKKSRSKKNVITKN